MMYLVIFVLVKLFQPDLSDDEASRLIDLMNAPPQTSTLIKSIHPKIGERTAGTWAQAIDKQAAIVGVSPLVFLTIIEHESGWRAQAISGDREDYGLMQVRARYYPGKPEWLLNGVENIRRGSSVIQNSKNLCRSYLKREPEYQEWLACYQGSCVARQMCKPTKLTKQFADYTACLDAQISSSETNLHTCRKIFDRKP